MATLDSRSVDCFRPCCRHNWPILPNLFAKCIFYINRTKPQNLFGMVWRKFLAPAIWMSKCFFARESEPNLPHIWGRHPVLYFQDPETTEIYVLHITPVTLCIAIVQWYEQLVRGITEQSIKQPRWLKPTFMTAIFSLELSNVPRSAPHVSVTWVEDV